MKIYQLLEKYHDVATDTYVECQMTFLAENDDAAIKANLMHPFRLTPFIILDEFDRVVYDHKPASLEKQPPGIYTFGSPTVTDIKSFIELFDSFSSIPVIYRRHYDDMLASLDQPCKEGYRNHIEDLYSPIRYSEEIQWHNDMHPVRRRRIYCTHVMVGWRGISS